MAGRVQRLWHLGRFEANSSESSTPTCSHYSTHYQHGNFMTVTMTSAQTWLFRSKSASWSRCNHFSYEEGTEVWPYDSASLWLCQGCKGRRMIGGCRLGTIRRQRGDAWWLSGKLGRSEASRCQTNCTSSSVWGLTKLRSFGLAVFALHRPAHSIRSQVARLWGLWCQSANSSAVWSGADSWQSPPWLGQNRSQISQIGLQWLHWRDRPLQVTLLGRQTWSTYRR